MSTIEFRSLVRNAQRLLAVAALSAVLVGCGEKLSRDDFAAAVRDKSTADVQKAVGKPDAIDESAPGTIKWTYKSKTFTTGDAVKLDTTAVVVFQQREGAPALVADVLYD